MEIEKRQPEMGKKLWNIVRVVLYMMRRSNTKRKTMVVELNTLLKKGKNGLSNLILQQRQHYSALTCRPNDANAAFVSPRDYEFSCTNTPLPKRKTHRQADDLKLMQNVFGILGRHDEASSAEIDRDAEEFINKFYRELRNQRPVEASPYHE